MQSIGRTIRLLRQRRGWNQEEVARQLGISIPAFSKIETGITDMNLSRVQQIADLFGLSVIDLLTNGQQPEDGLQASLESTKERLRERESEVMDLQRKVIELFHDLKKRPQAVKALN